MPGKPLKSNDNKYKHSMSFAQRAVFLTEDIYNWYASKGTLLKVGNVSGTEVNSSHSFNPSYYID